jgi:hypothetical protein
MHSVRGVFDGQRIIAIDPIPVHNRCDVVIMFLDSSVVTSKKASAITAENISISERISALKKSVGKAYSESPMFAEKHAK